MKYISRNIRQTQDLGRGLAKKLRGGEILCLYGELGSGKTTFARGMINYFLPAKRVLSPTFIIVRHYYPENNKINHIIHSDLYRLNKGREIEDLGLSEFFHRSGCVVLIEWPDRMKGLLPSKRTDIRFIQTDNRNRTIKIT